jgi:hypothetical protein
MYELTQIALETGRYTTWRDSNHITRIAKSSRKKNSNARSSAHRFHNKGIAQQRPSNAYMTTEASLMLPPELPGSDSYSDIHSDTISMSNSLISDSRSQTRSVSRSQSQQPLQQPLNHERIQLEEENKRLVEELATLKAHQKNKKLREEIRELQRQ